MKPPCENQTPTKERGAKVGGGDAMNSGATSDVSTNFISHKRKREKLRTEGWPERFEPKKKIIVVRRSKKKKPGGKRRTKIGK